MMRVSFYRDTVVAGGRRLHGIKMRSGPSDVAWVREYDKDKLSDQMLVAHGNIYGRITSLERFVWNNSVCYRGSVMCFIFEVSLYSLSP